MLLGAFKIDEKAAQSSVELLKKDYLTDDINY